ncbi:MAG: acetylglutamate kinase [Sedimentibacter sp.]
MDSNKVMVVKYGGSAMVDDDIKKSVMDDLVKLKLSGYKLIIVHGGGNEINNWVKKLGINNTFINGLRVTDSATMEIAEMALNKINKELVQIVEKLGIKAVGISGKDGSTIKVEKRIENNMDIGYVGKIIDVDTSLLKVLLDNDYTPIISPIGIDDNYIQYNINADDVACAVAKAIKADKLVFLTGIQGVCKDPNDPSTLIPELTVPQAKEFLSLGFAGGGMFPKLTNCIDAVENGVSYVHILDGRVQHSLLNEFFMNKIMGTMILNCQEVIL